MTATEMYDKSQKHPKRIRGTRRMKLLVKLFQRAVVLRSQGEEPIPEGHLNDRCLSLFHKLLYDDTDSNPMAICISFAKDRQITVWHNLLSEDPVPALDALCTLAMLSMKGEKP